MVETGVSLNAQRNRLETYATMQGLDLVKIIHDASISGTVPLADRAGGAVVLNALVEHKAPHVVALKLDRLKSLKLQ